MLTWKPFVPFVQLGHLHDPLHYITPSIPLIVWIYIQKYGTIIYMFSIALTYKRYLTSLTERAQVLECICTEH